MTVFYDVLDYIKTELTADGIVNTVTTGDIFDVDLNKKTIYPLSHIMVNNASHQSNVVVFNVTVIAMDIVDKNYENTTDVFKGNDNEHDVLNTQLNVIQKVISIILKGENKYKYDIVGTPSSEPFTERFENYLAGWACTFDIMLPNDMNVC